MKEVIKKVIRALEHGHFMECGIDTLIRIDNKDLDNYCRNCRDCIFREKLEKTVFCPVRCKYIKGLRVLL